MSRNLRPRAVKLSASESIPGTSQVLAQRAKSSKSRGRNEIPESTEFQEQESKKSKFKNNTIQRQLQDSESPAEPNKLLDYSKSELVDQILALKEHIERTNIFLTTLADVENTNVQLKNEIGN